MERRRSGKTSPGLYNSSWLSDPRRSIAIPFTYPTNLEQWTEDPWRLKPLPQPPLPDLSVFREEKRKWKSSKLSKSAQLADGAEEETTLPEIKDEDDDQSSYPTPTRLILLMLGLSMCTFLVGLDRMIIATAIPKISSQFDSSDDIGWYGSAYLLTSCALQPVYGRVYTIFDIKKAFLITLAVFELGSLLCGSAPSSNAFILGRAVAGCGQAGIFSGSLVLIAHSVPLSRRPILTGILSSIFGVATILGPILGGVFTDDLSWRWCFYINLPVGAITVPAVFFFFKPQRREDSTATKKESVIHRLLKIDSIGNMMLIAAVVMLLLVLQWAGSTHAWNSTLIVSLLSGSALMTLLFLAWQWYRGDEALIPARIMCRRNVIAGCLGTFFLTGTLSIHIYYLPVWFQVVKSDSATRSGTNLTYYLLSNVFFSILAGVVVTKSGYYNFAALLGPLVNVVGCALLTTLDVNTPTSTWAGFQILTAAGSGMAIQQSIIAVQAVLPLNDAAIGTTVAVFFQSLGGAIFVSVGNNVLRDRFFSGVEALPGLSQAEKVGILNAGLTDVGEVVPHTPGALDALLVLYNQSIQRVFLVTVPLAALAFLAALGLEWRNLKAPNESRQKKNVEADVEP